MNGRPPRSPLFPSPPLSRSRGFELGRGQPAVIADRGAPPARLGQGLGEQPPQRMRIGGKQGGADNAADIVFAQDRRIETRSEEHTSELQSQSNLVCRLLLEK